MPWKKIANLRGPAGYNATGASEDDAAITAFARAQSGPTALNRALTELTGLNVKNFGAIGDGVHDDTAAIQAAIDAAIAGQAIIFPPSGSTNEFYRTTGNLLVTTPSLRFIGQPRDAYSVSIRCEVAGVTMLTAKHAGLVLQDIHFMGVEDIADGGTNGAGATVNGIDLYGTAAGDIDANIVGCTFQFLNVAARTRGRNAKFSDSTLFNNCLNGVVIDGEDPAYHSSAIQNRGNTITDCRFHNIGTSAANSGIEFTTTAHVIHAIVQDNFFDSNGYATHVRAIGTSANPHQRITCADNVHTELLASAYDFSYVYNFEISSPRVYGYTSGAFSGDAIRIDHCINFVVSDPFLYQIGLSGIVATNNSEGAIRGFKARLLGMSGVVSHGLSIDSTNTQMSFDDIEALDYNGWGFNGSPVASRFGRYSFRGAGGSLGAINSSTFLPDQIFISAVEMTPSAGSPSLSSIAGGVQSVGWLLDAAATESVAFQMPRTPVEWTQFNITLLWAPTTASAGSVAMQYLNTPLVPGAVAGGSQTGSIVTAFAAPAVANQVVATVIMQGVTPTASLMQGRALRVGADAGDTYGADIALIGVLLTRTR